MLTTVLLDLDGVVRHFDPAHGAAVESRYRLAGGALMRTAFEPVLLSMVLTGEITHEEWVRQVGIVTGSPEAARAWTADRGAVDWDLMAVVAELRSADVTVAVLTNGTSLIAADMRDLGLDDRFDAVFNSADIGYAKPDVRAFAHVCETLVVDPRRVFFTDDSADKLGGALELGMTARRFESVPRFRQDLLDLGFLR